MKKIPGCLVDGAFRFGAGAFRVAFRLVFPSGRFLALVVACPSRSAVAALLWRFRAARRAVPRSSRSVFGACFAPGSLRWAASFSGSVSVLGDGGVWSWRFVAPALLPR